MPKVKRQIDVVAIEDADDYVSARRALESIPEAPPEALPEQPPEAPNEAPPEAPPEPPQVVEVKEETVREVKTSPKRAPKRAPQKNLEKVEPVPEEVKPPPPPPPERPARDEAKVSCPDCGRSVSKKTLRYTHKYQCTGRRENANVTREPSPEAPTAPTRPVVMRSVFGRKAPSARYEHLQFF